MTTATDYPATMRRRGGRGGRRALLTTLVLAGRRCVRVRALAAATRSEVLDRPPRREFGRHLVELSRNRAKCGRFRVKFGRTQAKSGGFHAASNLVDSVQVLVEVDQIRPSQIGRWWSKSLHSCTTLDRNQPTSTCFGPISAQVGPDLAKLGRFRSGLARSGQTSACMPSTCMVLVPEC